MRILIAAVLGGLVMFFWGFASHMLLPIGNMGMKEAGNEDVVIAAMREGFPAGEGVYMVPGISPEKMNDPVAAAAYSAKAKANPNAFIVYQPQGEDGMDMGQELGQEFATNVVSSFLLAWVLALGAFGFRKRVMVSAAMGLFAWTAISVPYWNWYRFPIDLTTGALLQQVIGWTLAGAVMAWWLGRKGG